MAIAHDADLVVIRSCAGGALRGALTETFRGSLERDLLLLRGDRPAEGFRKILVPVDRRASADRAIARATELAAPGAEIEVVHAWLLPARLGDSLEGAGAAPLVAAVQDAALQRCERLVAEHSRPGVHLVARALHGPPRNVLVRHAIEGKFDLIVIPGHGRRRLTRPLLDSVADALVQGAPCSVLISGRR